MKKGLWALIVTVTALILLPQAALALSENPVVELFAGSIELTEASGVKHIKVVNGLDEDYTGTVTVRQGGNGSTSNTITISSGSHDVILEGDGARPIHIKTSAAPPISVEKDSTLTLTIRGSVTLDATGSGSLYAGLHVAKYATLAITTAQDAKLAATGGDGGGAGIGGNKNESSGAIILDGNGSITATGGGNAAGIGGGHYGSGDVTINDGTVTVTGGSNGAGIGGGKYGNGNVVINGGTITATCGTQGAGIGGGYHGSGNVSITGGTITATGGHGATGIGGGGGYPGVVSISGGTIIVTAGIESVGIGGGFCSGCNVDITGGTITVTGSFLYAAIGVDQALKGINISISNARIYNSTTADPTKEIRQYTNESPVHIVGGGSSFSTTCSLPDAAGNSGTVGAGGEGGLPNILMLEDDQIHDIANAVGGRFVIGADISAVSGGKLNGLAFNLSVDSIKRIAGDRNISGFVLAHKKSAGLVEKLPYTKITGGDRWTFYSAQAPAGNSPFALIMLVSDPPKPPKTGDGSVPLVWLSLCVLAIVGLGALVKRSRKA